MATQYSKVKSPPKVIKTQKSNLDSMVLDTMETISDIVGSTLGPGGKVVIIERQEVGLPNIITKDGVTVFKALGFRDPTKHAIMEAARDAASKTAHDAGDGTTCSSVLSEAIVRRTIEFTRANKKVSPQKAVRILENVFNTKVEPFIKKISMKATKPMLNAVAKVSANGDQALADAVVECFDLVGDDGNVTITELSGPSEYKVERIEGYPIPRGYDEVMGRFYPSFINDKANQRVFVEKPLFILYFGAINDIYTIAGIANIVGTSWQKNNTSPNVVLMATGFSESVMANLAHNFSVGENLKVIPLSIPLSPITNGQKELLDDLSAVTGATVFDPLNNPLPGLDVLEFDMGHLGGVSSFEMLRAKSTIIGFNSEELIMERAEILKVQSENANSILDKSITEERLAKMIGGIAKLTIVGSSYGEIREKKDRADDAIRSLQGAVKHGCLPAGGWTLIKVIDYLKNPKTQALDPDGVIEHILIPALQEPVNRLLSNVGFSTEETDEILLGLYKEASKDAKTARIYDCLGMQWVVAKDAGLLDSTPAVLEAIRNSLSIASLLGTLGGCIVYVRDDELERREAQSTNSFLRDAETDLDKAY